MSRAGLMLRRWCMRPVEGGRRAWREPKRVPVGFADTYVFGGNRFLGNSPGESAKVVHEWLEEHIEAPQKGELRSDCGAIVEGDDVPQEMSKRIRQAMFRSSQRGWLEMDVLLGKWAAKNLRLLSDDDKLFQLYERLLNEDGPFVYLWATRQEEPPEELAPIVEHIRDFVFENKGLREAKEG